MRQGGDKLNIEIKLFKKGKDSMKKIEIMVLTSNPFHHEVIFIIKAIDKRKIK